MLTHWDSTTIPTAQRTEGHVPDMANEPKDRTCQARTKAGFRCRAPAIGIVTVRFTLDNRSAPQKRSLEVVPPSISSTRKRRLLVRDRAIIHFRCSTSAQAPDEAR